MRNTHHRERDHFGMDLAEYITYDNSGSLLTADNVQDAIDELDATISSMGSSTPEFVGCKAYSTTTHSITASAIFLVPFDAEEYDTHSIHSTSSNTTRFTVPTGKGGHWEFHGGFFIDTPNSVDAQVGFRLNGTTLLRGTGVVQQTAFMIANTTTIVSLSVGDYVELYFYTSSSGRTIGHASAPDAQAWASATFIG